MVQAAIGLAEHILEAALVRCEYIGYESTQAVPDSELRRQPLQASLTGFLAVLVLRNPENDEFILRGPEMQWIPTRRCAGQLEN